MSQFSDRFMITVPLEMIIESKGSLVCLFNANALFELITPDIYKNKNIYLG